MTHRSSLRIIQSIARITFLEILRERLFYNIIVIAVLLMGIGVLAANLTFIQPARVLIDFGIAAINISCSMIAIFTGAALIPREIDRRTINLALSHPIKRGEFILGKFFGHAVVLILNWFLLLIVVLFVTQASMWSWVRTGFDIPLAFIVGAVLLLVQSFLLSALAIFFSTRSTVSLSTIFVLGLFIIGNSMSQLRFLAAKSSSPINRTLINAVSRVFPNLENFNLGFTITYDLPVSSQLVMTSLGYGIVYTAFVLLLASISLGRREI